jgi:hypothetical protein
VANKFYELRAPINRPGVKKRWIRIGSATEYALPSGMTAIACTLESTPLNWDGVFHVFPSVIAMKEMPDEP